MTKEKGLRHRTITIARQNSCAFLGRPGAILSKWGSSETKLSAGIDTNNSGSNGFHQEGARVFQDMVAISFPQVLLSNESGGKVDAHLLREREGVGIIVVDIRGRRIKERRRFENGYVTRRDERG